MVLSDTPEGRVIAPENQQRAQQGVPALVASSALTAAAEAHAREMATQNLFAHVTPHGATLVSRDETAGYLGWTCLELNLAAGMPTSSSRSGSSPQGCC